MARRKKGRKYPRQLTQALRIVGNEHLDPVYLASLSQEVPLLMVGEHGIAKTRLTTLIADATGSEYRHYNMSQVSFEDSFGIPVPVPGTKEIEFIGKGTVWCATFIFFDELNRARPDLANKYFSTIHERSVLGIELEHLKHRWAAMNPSQDESEYIDSQDYYLGTETLDPALIDRFVFVVIMPKQFSEAQLRLIIDPNSLAVDNDFSLPVLIEETQTLIEEISADDWNCVIDYVLCALQLLSKADLPQTPRRAKMIAEAIVAIHASRQVLEGPDVDWEPSMRLALLNTIPQRAYPIPPQEWTLELVHQQAYALAQHIQDPRWRKIFQLQDPVERILLADELGLSDEEISVLITQAIQAETSDPKRYALCASLYLAYHQQRNLSTMAWASIVQPFREIAEPRLLTVSDNDNDLSSIRLWVQSEGINGVVERLLRNYLFTGWSAKLFKGADVTWSKARDEFTTLLKQFGLSEKPTTSTSPFGRRLSRASSSRSEQAAGVVTQLANLSLTQEFVRFDIETILSDLASYFDQPIDNVSQLIRVLEQANQPKVRNLKIRLKRQWKKLDLSGVAMLAPWSTEYQQALKLQPTGLQIELGENEERERISSRFGRRLTMWQATDMLLVLNVLTRSPSDILVMNREIVLETAFLSRSLVSDDPRLVALAKQLNARKGAI